jgi:hypothetical protein
MGWDWGMGGTLGAVWGRRIIGQTVVGAWRAQARRGDRGEATSRGVGSGGERLAACLVGLVLATLRVVSPTPDWILYWEQAFV